MMMTSLLVSTSKAISFPSPPRHHPEEGVLDFHLVSGFTSSGRLLATRALNLLDTSFLVFVKLDNCFQKYPVTEKGGLTPY